VPCRAVPRAQLCNILLEVKKTSLSNEQAASVIASRQEQFKRLHPLSQFLVPISCCDGSGADAGEVGWATPAICVYPL